MLGNRLFVAIDAAAIKTRRAPGAAAGKRS
jgi:hypothetical protein